MDPYKNMIMEDWWFHKTRELEVRVKELGQMPHDTPAWELFAIVVDIFNMAEYLRVCVGNQLGPMTRLPDVFR